LPIIGAVTLVALLVVSLAAFAAFTLAAGRPPIGRATRGPVARRAFNVFHDPSGLIQPPPIPTDTSLAMSSTVGSPGDKIFIAASGYTSGEQVEPIWNYTGPGTGIPQKSFYEFNPITFADATGGAQTNFWIPESLAGTFTIAFVGLTSGVVRTASYQVVPEIDLGNYEGGQTLRLTGWGFGSVEAVNIYWNYSGPGTGTLISQAQSDHEGFFYNRTYTVPAGTLPGQYTIAAVGVTTGLVAENTYRAATIVAQLLPVPGDWTAFGYNQQNTRVNPTETTISPANVSTLAPKWKVALPVLSRVIGSPVITNGIVLEAAVGGTVSAYDANTGNLLWVFYAPGPVYGTPTVTNGIAYFGSVNIPGESRVGNYAFALEVSSGQLIWDNYLTYGGEWVAPLLANGRVIFASAGKEGVNGGETAYDALTGATVWSFPTPFGIWAPATINPSGTDIYQPTGNPCFEITPTPGDACAGYLLDINASTGAITWQIHFYDYSGDDDAPAAAVYDNGNLYLGTKNGLFYSVNASTGAINWQYDTASRGDFGIYSSAALYNGQFYFGGGDHLIRALGESSGTLTWSFAARSLVTTSPTEANGVLYVGSEDKFIYALNPTTGAQLWSYNTGAAVWSSAAIAHGVMYIADGAGYLYAFTPGGH